MEPMEYTVRSINGDYADLVSDTGVENHVAMLLLPEGTDVDSRLLFEDFQWTLLWGQESKGCDRNDIRGTDCGGPPGRRDRQQRQADRPPHP